MSDVPATETLSHQPGSTADKEMPDPTPQGRSEFQTGVYSKSRARRFVYATDQPRSRLNIWGRGESFQSERGDGCTNPSPRHVRLHDQVANCFALGLKSFGRVVGGIKTLDTGREACQTAVVGSDDT